jgi:hypothetical protein
LIDFFGNTFSRNTTNRFESGERMHAVWDDIYGTTVHSRHDHADLDRVSPETSLSTLGVSTAALEQLDILDIDTIEEFLTTPTNKFHFQAGSGKKIREELVGLHEQLSEVVPQVTGDSSLTDAKPRGEIDYENYSIDRVLDVLLEKPKKFDVDLQNPDVSFPDIIRQVLGCANLDLALPWPEWQTIEDRVHRELGFNPSTATQIVEELRAAWYRKAVLPSVRDDLTELIDKEGGVASDETVARGLLGMRGALISDKDKRLAAAAAISRAAFEFDSYEGHPELTLFRRDTNRKNTRGIVFVASNPSMLDVIPELGACADSLSELRNLPSPTRAAQRLAEIISAAELPVPEDRRLLEIASHASNNTALSKRGELYPVGMSAEAALQLTTTRLRRRAPLESGDLREMVAAQYPAAESLPEHPALEDVVKEADVGLKFDPSAFEGRGGYVSIFDSERASPAISVPFESEQSQHSTMPGESEEGSPREATDRLRSRAKEPGMLVVEVDQGDLPEATTRLATALGFKTISLEKLLIDEVRKTAEQNQVPWQTVLETDGIDLDDPGNRTDRRNFKKLVFQTGQGKDSVGRRVLDRVLEVNKERVLLTNVGLIGRWEEFLRWDQHGDRMQILQALYDRKRKRGPNVIWMVVPATSDTNRPKLADQPIEVDERDSFRMRRRYLEALQ